jgi:hypothetical protein
MSDFEKPPFANLPDESALRTALTETSWMDNNPFTNRVRSQFIIDTMNEIVAGGQYPYNTVVMRNVERKLGIEKQHDNSSPLSMLVYLAQQFRHSEDFVNAGFVPLTQELVNEAYTAKEKILCANGSLYTPRIHNGEILLFLPRVRNRCLMIQGQAVKRVHPKNAVKLAHEAREKEGYIKVMA